jgi:hypothetical protein
VELIRGKLSYLKSQLEAVVLYVEGTRNA